MKSSRWAAMPPRLRGQERSADGPAEVTEGGGDHPNRQRGHEEPAAHGVLDGGDERVAELAGEAPTEDDQLEIDQGDGGRQRGAERLGGLVEELAGDLVAGGERLG